MIMNSEIPPVFLPPLQFTQDICGTRMLNYFLLEVFKNSRAGLEIKPGYFCSINQTTVFLHLESWAMR